MSEGDGSNYEVGYGRPPAHSRFQPGQSGNPRGRRKGTRGVKSDLQDELASSHTIQINGRPIKGTKQRLMIMALATRAASGELKAAALLLPLIQQTFGFEDRGGERSLSAKDEALLNQLLSGAAETATPSEARDVAQESKPAEGPDDEG